MRIFLLLFFLQIFNLVSSRLSVRHAQTPGEAFWNTVGGAVDWGLSEGTKLFWPPIQNTGDAVKDFLTPDPDPDPAPVYKLHTECDGQQPSRCKVTTKYIIWPKKCSPQYEAEIIAFLAKNVGGKPIDTARDVECEAVYFWSAELTNPQAQELGHLQGVIAVEPNKIIDFGKVGAQAVKFQQPQRATPLQKRDILLKRNDFEDKTLSYLSRGSNVDEENVYYFFSKNGIGTTIYLPSSGVQLSHAEFSETASSVRFLYSFGIAQTPTDEDGSGTCHASLAGGQFKGVASDVNIVVVKHSTDQDSVMNAILLVLRDLKNRFDNGEELQGYNVISIPYGWLDEGRETDQRMKGLMVALLRIYQVVVVAAAGDATNEPNLERYIPAGLSIRYPVITVGGVDINTGRRYDSSPVGDFVSVLAAGYSYCASKFGGQLYSEAIGTAPAASFTAGLAAYLLSLDDLGPILRSSTRSMGIPTAVRNWIVDKAWARKDGTPEDKAIWNGLRISNLEGLWDPRTGLGTIGGWQPPNL